ncbi:MAG: Ig-like domain-containing protein, partial [Coprococcus sp.]|nr:Ig-like domain-containing protein [Coprococcus sp.]
YTNYKKYQQFMGSQSNDNDEFMWSANFVDTVDMKTLTGTSHNYETVSEPAYCGRNAFTEERCSDCGLIKEGTRVEAENTAHEHHYIKFHETYYTKDKSKNWNEADNYVCPECGACITEPVKSKYEQANSTYEKRKAIWDEAQKNAAEGHAYAATDAEWSDDHTSVTFQNLKCETCANQINKLDCLLESDENATNKANRDSIKNALSEKVTATAKLAGHTGTCEQGVTMYYKAADKTAGGVKYVVTTTEAKEAGKHAYTGAWTWTEVKDDNGNVTGYTASVTGVKCSVCDNEPTEDQIKVNVVKDTENSKAATCTEKGKDVYTATATVTDADGKEIGTLTADPKEVDLPALGHKYGEPTWNWTKGENNTYTATATFTCANDEKHVETVDAKVTEKSDGATCTEAGKITYTATVTFEGKDYTATKTEEVAALGHNYGEPTWNWSKGDDGSYTAIATFTCDRCKDVQKVVATVGDPVETKATCEADGKTVYTAKVTFNGKDYTNTKEETIKAIGHKYGEPTWNWIKGENNTYTATATFTCANDEKHVETVDAKVTEKSDGATCTEAGKIVYTAKVTFNGKDYTESKEETVGALGHDYQTTTTKATLSKDGSIVTKCTRCGDVTENTTIAYPKTITLSEDHYVYDGQEKKPEVSVVGSDGKAISADNYDVKYPESAVAGGSYDVVITFKGNYEGTVTKTFTIGQMDSELKYAKSSVTVDYKGGAVVDNAYTSKASAKDIKFTTSNKNVAAVDSEGNVTIVGPGTATITAQISGSESYKDAKAAYTVKVNSLATPAVPKVTNGKDGAVVTWTAVKNAETYSVWRKTSSTGWKKLATVEGTTYTDKTAESNQTYYYTIRCMNAGKNICTSDYNRTGTKAYYLAPSNISSLTLTSNGIAVKWNKVAGAKSYRIYRKTTGGYTRIGTVNSGNTTSYTDTTAESGKTYTYAVKPYNGNASADYTGKQVTYLATPALSTLANAANGVSLKWNSISGAQKYYIYRKEGNGGYKKIAEVKDAVSYTDKSVTSGKKYTYAVRALKGSSMSAYTGKSINYLAQANVSALNNKDNGIEVKWSKVSGAKGYYVYRKEGKNSYKKIATITNANTTSYTDTSVKNNNGKAYTYTVRAYANNALAAYTGKSVYRIATPTITSVSNSRKGEVDVDWNGVKGAKGYQIQLSSDKSFSKDTTDETWVDYADGNGITITNCEKGDSFYFRVRAYKQNGSGTKYYSAWSTKSVKVTK